MQSKNVLEKSYFWKQVNTRNDPRKLVILSNGTNVLSGCRDMNVFPEPQLSPYLTKMRLKKNTVIPKIIKIE